MATADCKQTHDDHRTAAEALCLEAEMTSGDARAKLLEQAANHYSQADMSDLAGECIRNAEAIWSD